MSGFGRFWQPMTGTLRHFFGSSSSLLRVRFGKTGLFPKNSRTRVGECPENQAFPAGYSCPEASAFIFKEFLIFNLFICIFRKHRIYSFWVRSGSSCCFVNAYFICSFTLMQRTKRSGFKTFTLPIEPALKSLKLTPVGRLTTPSGLRGLGYWFFNPILQPRFRHKTLAHYCLFFIGFAEP